MGCIQCIPYWKVMDRSVQQSTLKRQRKQKNALLYYILSRSHRITSVSYRVKKRQQINRTTATQCRQCVLQWASRASEDFTKEQVTNRNNAQRQWKTNTQQTQHPHCARYYFRHGLGSGNVSLPRLFVCQQNNWKSHQWIFGKYGKVGRRDG